MHTVANQVEMLIDRLEEPFIQAAVPGFAGSVTVDIRVLPTAAHEVEFTVHRKCSEQVRSTKETVPAVISNERVQKVRLMIAEHRARFTLGTPIVSVTGHYVDGVLRSFDVHTSEKL